MPGVVNGSLWSLQTEVTMYLLLVAAGLMRANRWVFLALALLWAAIAQFRVHTMTEMIVFYGSDLRQVILCGTFFWVGAVFREFNVARWFSLSAVTLAFIALLSLEAWTTTLRVGAWVLLPVVVLGFGLSHSPVLARLTRSGDYSYGVYIYAFPVQQVVAHFWPGLPIGTYIAVVTPIVLLLAVASWHLVEAPALRFKPRASHPR